MWHVYIVKCSDNSLYTGITTDIKRRISEHNSSHLGAKYTAGRRPVELVYSEELETKSEASKREWEIKKMKRSGKEKFIESS